jgi:DNA-directed RNA polymerase specialized sigma24 family protein
MRGETSQELLRAFLRLTPEHRRVIGLRQLEGLPAAQAARRLGRSETAVHSLFRRALQAWSEELGGAQPG